MKKASLCKYLSVMEKIFAHRVSKGSGRKGEKFALKTLHGASLAVQIIAVLDLKSARKVKVEEVNEFSCWRLIILAAGELNKFLMFAHIVVCALHLIVWVKWLLQRKVICLVTSMQLCWEALSRLLLLLWLLCETQAGSQLFTCLRQILTLAGFVCIL